MMRVPESCAKCLYDKQARKTNDPEYLAEIKRILENRREEDTSPYMVYLFNKVHTRFFGAPADYSAVKREFNDLVLGMEDSLRHEIEAAPDPLAKALAIARTGNYIDFAAMETVDRGELVRLLGESSLRDEEKDVYESFVRDCSQGDSFLLICDNCGEIVLDKLLIEQIALRFPNLTIRALVRGGEVLNDVTIDDALYVGLDKVAGILTNGEAIGGTVYDMMPDDARAALDTSDVILSKGQANYESLTGQGRHIYYEFLCKCDLFTSKFGVPMLTGMFVAE